MEPARGGKHFEKKKVIGSRAGRSAGTELAFHLVYNRGRGLESFRHLCV
jgi:hypothetical protein